MTTYQNQKYIGERALFNTHNAKIINCKFSDGESPLKESSNLDIKSSEFSWKYPLWYSKDIIVNDSLFQSTARSGIWYTDNITINNTSMFCPKVFRRSTNITLNNVFLSNALETFWNCNNIKLTNVQAKGDYFGFNSSDIECDNFTIDGNYVFDGASNIHIKNSKIISKDAFWNCENVIVEDSYIIGEYLCWNTKNITFKNCVIESEQGMCYVSDLVLENCSLLNTTLSFEYSDVKADINTKVDSIKNPNSGVINALGYGEIIIDKNLKTNISNTSIRINNKEIDVKGEN